MVKIPGLENPRALKCHDDVAQVLLVNGTVFQLRLPQASPKVSQVEQNVADFCISRRRGFYLHHDGSVKVQVGGKSATTIRVGEKLE